MFKRTFFSFLLVFQASSSFCSDNTSLNAKDLIIGKILDEIATLKRKNNTEGLIHASYAQISCIEKLSDTRYGMRECRKEYKRALLYEKVAFIKKYKDLK